MSKSFVKNILAGFLPLASVAVLAASCDLSGDNYESTFQISASFDDLSSYKPTFNSEGLMEPENKESFFAEYNYQLFFSKFSSGAFLGGVALCNASDTTGSAANRWVSYTGKGNSGSELYAVVHEGSDNPEQFISYYHPSEASTSSPSEVYVNNTASVVRQIRSTFTDGDYFDIVFTGYDSGRQTGRVSFHLARYAASGDSVVTAWTKVSLSSLGKCRSVGVGFNTTTEKVDKTACIDDMLTDMYLKY